MSWRSLFTTGDGLERVELRLIEMLRLDQRSFELANQALLHGSNAEQLRRTVSDTDHQVNELVQEIRRELIVHASVRETAAHVPAMFTYMSIIKDIERVGDYAKNILDIAFARADLSAASDLDDLTQHRDAIGQLLEQVTVVLADRDAEAANRLLEETVPQLAQLDERIDELIVSDRPGYEVVPRALYYRHLKRIAAHLMNVLTSLTAPVDQLDFYRDR